MMGSGDVKRLKEYSLFGGLSDADIKCINGIVNKKTFDVGSTVVQEGDSGDELFLLEEGIVDISKTLTIVTSKHDFGQKERSFIRLSSDIHPYFGEMALFGSGERSATVKAVTACKVLIIRHEDFNLLCAEEPRIGYIVLKNIALTLVQYLRKTNEDVIKLTTALSLALSGDK